MPEHLIISTVILMAVVIVLYWDGLDEPDDKPVTVQTILPIKAKPAKTYTFNPRKDKTDLDISGYELSKEGYAKLIENVNAQYGDVRFRVSGVKDDTYA